MSKLTALEVRNASPGKHEDGHGLRLVKRANGGGKWVYRYSLRGGSGKLNNRDKWIFRATAA